MKTITSDTIEKVLDTANILINQDMKELAYRPFGYEDEKRLKKLKKAISLVNKQIDKELEQRKGYGILNQRMEK